MMDLDEELTLRIKSVFEDIDDGQSEFGWASLRSKYPNAGSKRTSAWLPIGIAATVLIGMACWLLFDRPIEESIPTDQLVKEGGASNQSIPKSVDKPSVLSAGATKSPEEGFSNSSISSPSNFSAPIKSEIQAAAQIANPLPDKNKQIIELIDSARAMQTSILRQDSPATLVANSTPKGQINEPSNTIENKKTTEDFLNEQSKILLGGTVKKDRLSSSANKNSFEVFTGTFLNYYADNEVKVNAGFGVNANFKVANRLFVSVGAGVSQNKIAYKAEVPTTVSADVQSSYAKSLIYINKSIVSDVRLTAQLVSFDLPITFKFYPTKKQNFYLSTGFNSNSYFSQQYIYDYTIRTISSNSSKAVQYEDGSDRRSFSGFDFANSAIFALGINQRIGKANQLIFEPYLKPAIGHMGSKNLKINTVGLNLKFSFNADKK